LIRTYRPGDEEAVVALWNRALPADGIDVDRFCRKVLADPNFDPEGALVAEEGGEPVGFLLALARRSPLAGVDLEPREGWITVFFVDPERRRRGHGSRLLEAALRFLAGRRVSVSPYAPNYFWPGVDPDAYPEAMEFLERRGFRRLYGCAAMDRRLVGYAVPEEVRRLQRSLEDQGFRFHHLEPRFVTGLLDFNARHFHPDWARAVREAIARGAPFDRFLLATRGGRVAGYCTYGTYDHVPDRFGPFGVDPDLRGMGLGKVLLHGCLDEMRRKGFHDAWFLWTGEDDPAGRLYRRAGFEVTRRFWILAREPGASG
jgi:mycothiol synthase